VTKTARLSSRTAGIHKLATGQSVNAVFHVANMYSLVAEASRADRVAERDVYTRVAIQT
jgi:hypothetical protein